MTFVHHQSYGLTSISDVALAINPSYITWLLGPPETDIAVWNSEILMEHTSNSVYITSICSQCRRDAVIPSKSNIGTATNAVWFVFLFTKTSTLYHIMAEKIWETWLENPIQVRQNTTSQQPWYGGPSDFEMEHHLSKGTSEAHRSWFGVTTLNLIFSVTYYLELRNAITVNCSSHFLPTKVKLVVWTLWNINIFSLVTFTLIVKDIAMCNSE